MPDIESGGRRRAPRALIAPLLLLTMIASLAVTPAHALVDCFDPKGKCDWQPPCEYYREIKALQGVRALMQSQAFRDSLIAAAIAEEKAETGRTLTADKPLIQQRAIRLLPRMANRIAQDGKSIPLPKCKRLHDDPPSAITHDDCSIVFEGTSIVNGEPVRSPLSDAQVESSNACREFVDAIRAHEGEHRRFCCYKSCSCGEASCTEGRRVLRCNQDPNRPECAIFNGQIPAPPFDGKTLAGFADEEAHGYTVAIKYLVDLMASKKPRCSGENRSRSKSPRRAIQLAAALSGARGGVR